MWFFFQMRSAYLSEIQLSPGIGLCEYVAPICLSVVGKHSLVEISVQIPCMYRGQDL
jgi:hypothetical protein